MRAAACGAAEHDATVQPLEILQTACALLLISLMLFVTTKDLGDTFRGGSSKEQEVVFP